MRRYISLLVGGLLLFTVASPAWAQGRKLNDDELDKVTAGGVSAQVMNGVLNFQFQSRAGSKHTVDGSGTVAAQAQDGPGNTGPAAVGAGTLILQDSAQGNLRSFININAVNSRIQVLVNLNININSTVGTVRQINLSGAP